MSYLLFPIVFYHVITQVKEGLCTEQVQTQNPGLLNNTQLAFRVGYLQQKICMTSHSAEDKAHWFFSQTGRWGVAVRAMQGQARGKEKC